MHWKFVFCHSWDGPGLRRTWEDVLLLPDDPSYDGGALWLTVEGGATKRWDRETITLTLATPDFDLRELLEATWIALDTIGVVVDGLVPAPLTDFCGRSEHADMLLLLLSSSDEGGDEQ